MGTALGPKNIRHTYMDPLGRGLCGFPRLFRGEVGPELSFRGSATPNELESKLFERGLSSVQGSRSTLLKGGPDRGLQK